MGCLILIKIRLKEGTILIWVVTACYGKMDLLEILTLKLVCKSR
jgi:hypothetical protein